MRPFSKPLSYLCIMAVLRYIIRKSKVNKQGLTNINLRYAHASKKIELSTGEKIEPKYWDANKGQPKIKYPEWTYLDEQLMKFEQKAKRIIRSAMLKDINPIPEYFKEEFLKKEAIIKDEKKEFNFFEKFDEYRAYLKVHKRPNTLKNFNSLYKHLKTYEKKKRTRLTFDRIDHRFYDKFINYLITDLGLTDNTVDDKIKTVKTFLYWATRQKYNKRLDFKDFKRCKRDAEFIYLTEEELFKILNYDFSTEKQKNYESARDVFCFCCFTGLRYSDIASLKLEHIEGNHILKKMQKTSRYVKVPLSKYAQDILTKHKDNNDGIHCFNVFVNPVMNRYLKEIGEKAGIDSMVTLSTGRGGETIDNTQPKYKFITSHTARRTFITLSLQKGMRPEVVMKIVGHSDIRTMMKYVRLADDILNDEMLKAWD